MYLKSLVLKGFKSFADRSVLSLEPGITAVVGPNGSGKSNISDAVLWVLGERNAKNLRGQAMEDVIFAGSSARKSVGIAEVDLVLDNSDSTLPVEYAQVALTRRMYRSGESEYLINGTPARRMDVLDILHDSGLGTATHSIISQGSLDSILQSKPEDRRALIEEAAGVLKHKQRKAKSERKLERMDTHLTRVKDVAAEVQRQLVPLKRKAQRARRYEELSSQLAELSLALAVDDLKMLQKAWDEACAKQSILDDELAQKKAAMVRAEREVDELQRCMENQGATTEELAASHRRVSSVVERCEGACLLLREKRRSARAREQEVGMLLQTNAQRRASLQDECAKANAQLELAGSEKVRAQAEVERLEGLRAQAYEGRALHEREVNELDKRCREQERDLDKARGEQAQSKEVLSRSLARIKLIDQQQQKLDASIQQTRLQQAACLKAAHEQAEALAALQEEEKATRDRMEEGRAQHEQARAALDATRDKIRLLQSQIKGLQEVERSSQTHSPALRWAVDHAQDFSDLTPLSHAVVAPPQLELLVEQLLGQDLDALLTSDPATGSTLAAALADRDEEGRVVLLFQEDRVPWQTRMAAAHTGATPLIDHLSYPEASARALKALLGDVVLCENLDEALAAHEKDEYGLRFATRDAQVVWPQGKLSIAGAHRDEQEGVLARHRHLETLRSELLHTTECLEGCQQDVSRKEHQYREAQTQSLEVSQRLAELRGTLQASQTQVEAVKAKLDGLMQEREEVEKQGVQARRQIADARPGADHLDHHLLQLHEALAAARKELSAKQEALVPLRKEAARLNEALVEARVKTATLTERESSMARLAQSRSLSLAELKNAEQTARKDMRLSTMVQRRSEPLLACLEEVASDARGRIRSLEEALGEAQKNAGGMHTRIHEARTALRQAREAFDEVNKKREDARVNKGRLEVQVQTALKAIVQDGKTSLEQALCADPLQNRKAAEEEAFKLRRRIANMGAINPEAAEEYETLKQRYDYLDAQLSDLESARRALSKIVRVIDARMKDDFIKTFQQVSVNFSQIFSVLFPGGSAELTLVDPQDLEHSGVEVRAQPRGKRITKMMLMSGGEKSLTALALLFAVYRIRSTPFYILDEVEAALDDSNLRRLTAYLETLRDHTQLILITHQRRTMEMADVLFGVSMQADGVTRVVSQKLEHALAHAE